MKYFWLVAIISFISVGIVWVVNAAWVAYGFWAAYCLMVFINAAKVSLQLLLEGRN